MSGRDARECPSRGGFSLLEVMMALFVVAFGVLGLASTTLLITRQLTMADATTGRMIALQNVLEGIHATPFDSVGTGGDTIGPIVISWTTTSTAQSKTVNVVSVGPGLTTGPAGTMMSNAVADTVQYLLVRP